MSDSLANTPSVIVVAGPTASGKSDFAVELALSKSRNVAPFVDGEIISADSRQIYRGLDIGTGKITNTEMKGVPHHMIDVYNIDQEEDISVSQYVRDARPILEDIITRGKTPIICGGTGQYIDALIFDTAIPKVAPNKKLREEYEKKSKEELFEEINIKDPIRAAKIDKYNRVRLIRALEIIETLGRVPVLVPQKFRYPTHIYLLSPSRELLRKRVTLRLTMRLGSGMIDEVRHIMEQGYTSEGMKKFGLEYATIGKFLEGKRTEDQMIDDLTNKTMQYAKRQETWNKRYAPHATRIEVKN